MTSATVRATPADLARKSPGTLGTDSDSLKAMASAAKADRNRAIDLYRAVAMIAVAIGHWIAMDVAFGDDGALVAGNALEAAPGLSVLSWVFQVMPLFFVVGGFSSAMSLDSFNKRGASDPKAPGNRPQDWVIARLRRMLAPTVALATTWVVLIAAGFALGQQEVIAVGAVSAAIPLWFLANYTIDTAIAPYVLPLFRRYRVGVTVGGITVFCALEASRFLGVPAISHMNWILGWLLFQVAGFAWKDGVLPSPKILAPIVAGLWAAAVAAVTIGPYPISMVHFPGIENSPTHPPSLALMFFGGAYSGTAILVAPAVSRWLARHQGCWTGVVAANGVAMSVYLWHFTAAIGAIALFAAIGWLPTAAVGSGLWWIQKIPVLAVSALILGAIVANVMGIERRALLAERVPFAYGQVAMLALAAVLSTALKQWAHGNFIVASCCIGVVIGLWHLVIKSPNSHPDKSRLTGV